MISAIDYQTMPSDRGGDTEEEDDDVEFAECAFCGVSAAGAGRGGGFDLDSAFAKSSGGTSGSIKVSLIVMMCEI